mmetsp:Transcript_16274/g.23974  ORF Transcript_16274/g.23974 Transcript_16274/m.23974 type:complete len:506 (-) Transcript_16274:38-1555(-)
MDENGASISHCVVASKIKDEGNVFLADNKYTMAIERYSEALEFFDLSNQLRAILLSNRSLAYIKTESYGLAITDASDAIKADATYPKGYYRRGTAEFALNRSKAARKDFRAVCKLKPKDRDARAKLAECEKAVREAAFAAAIESEETEPLSETLDVSAMSIEASYKGPHPKGGADALDSAEEEKFLFTPGNLPVEFVQASVERFKNQELISKRYVAQLLISCKTYFETLPSLLEINLPEDVEGSKITVCGDTHGQFYDVMNIFEMNGFPSAENPYLFNGDFVDRGSFSVEVILTYLLFKIASPNGIHLLRGNHETKNMNRIYGFMGEVLHKYDKDIFDLFLEVFNVLPLAAVIGGKVFVTHGGIPCTPGVTLDDIRGIKRGCEPPDSGLMSDLLWSDPQPFPGKSPSKRGIGWSFGPDITAAFLESNGLELLVRSHEVKDDGYLVEHGGKTITIFSAPNYCDQMGNKGAFIHFEGDLKPSFTQYDAVSHPPVRPMAYAAGMGGLF